MTWLLPPYNYSLRRIANEFSIGAATVSKWRKELALEGLLKEDVEQRAENFTVEQIFSFVIETLTMTEHELAEYCRGLYVKETIQALAEQGRIFISRVPVVLTQA